MAEYQDWQARYVDVSSELRCLLQQKYDRLTASANGFWVEASGRDLDYGIPYWVVPNPSPEDAVVPDVVVPIPPAAPPPA